MNLLQEAIEDELQRHPKIENDKKAFRDFAINSHYSAYVHGGILELSIMDKVRILLTPDIGDLLSEEGQAQIKKIGKEQIRYYKNDKWFSFKQNLELLNNIGPITSLVIDYAVRNFANPFEVWRVVKIGLGL
jgi:hypothetical protein